MWVIQNQDKNLPKWLTDNLSDKCECGSDIENFYNSHGKITSTRCSSPECPYVVAKKVKAMCHDFLKTDGIGDATALKIVKENKLKSHLDAVPIIYKTKPRVSFYNVMRMCFIEGIDTGWAHVVGNCESLDDLLKVYRGDYRNLILYHEELIRKAESVFDVAKSETKEKYNPVLIGTVMLSGNIKGFKERNHFIYALNQYWKGLVRISIAEHKRKTGIMALIQEADSPNRGKAACALESGIPIMTPNEFSVYVVKEIQRKLDC